MKPLCLYYNFLKIPWLRFNRNRLVTCLYSTITFILKSSHSSDRAVIYSSKLKSAISTLFDVASIPIHKAFSGADGVSYLFQAVRHMRAYILLNNVVSLLIRLRRVKKYNLEYYEGFIVWITRNDVLNMIYGQRIYFVELRRGWSKGMKLIFMKKTHDIDYCFIGSGIIDRVIDPSEFSSLEKILCASNNCYRKIIFGQLARFCPNCKRTIVGI